MQKINVSKRRRKVTKEHGSVKEEEEEVGEADKPAIAPGIGVFYVAKLPQCDYAPRMRRTAGVEVRAEQEVDC